MKLRDIFHDDNRVWKSSPLWVKTIIKHIHELQEEIEYLKKSVSHNTAHTNKGKYVTPDGKFKTYKAAAEARNEATGNNFKWTHIRKWIKDPNKPSFYLEV